jgi:hypothetical protein
LVASPQSSIATTPNRQATICIIYYLKGMYLLLLQLGETNSMQLIGYFNLNYSSCPNTCKFIAGCCYSLGSGAVSWSSQKQKKVADSFYAKYIALHNTSYKAIFLCQLLSSINLLSYSPTMLFCDNNTALHIIEDHIWLFCIKHIHVKYHYMCELIADRQLTI